MLRIIKTYFIMIIYISIGLLLSLLASRELTYFDKKSFYFLLGAYFLYGIIVFFLFYSYKVEIFEPIIIVTVTYYFMFLITPMLDIINGNRLFFNISTENGLIKATIIFLIGYLSFSWGYFKKKNLIEKINIRKEDNNKDKKIILKINIVIWSTGFLLNSLYIISSGKSFLYTLTLGVFGNINSAAAINSPLGFVGMFGFLMISSWMYISQYSKNSYLKIITYILMFISFTVRGFRFILVIIIMAPIILYYIKRNRKPKVTSLVSLIAVLLLMVGLIGMNRGALRNGENITLGGFDLEVIITSLNDNFSQYKTFYLMVSRIPKTIPYSWGAKILVNPFLMFIPRILWSNKISLGSVSDSFLGEAAKIAGSAYPNIGEYYMDFGVFGVILFMLIFGWVCGFVNKIKDSNIANIHTFIGFSIFVPTTLQLVIRGHMATNLYLLLFLFAPIVLSKKIYQNIT